MPRFLLSALAHLRAFSASDRETVRRLVGQAVVADRITTLGARALTDEDNVRVAADLVLFDQVVAAVTHQSDSEIVPDTTWYAGLTGESRTVLRHKRSTELGCCRCWKVRFRRKEDCWN
jgi:hypothetical protein